MTWIDAISLQTVHKLLKNDEDDSLLFCIWNKNCPSSVEYSRVVRTQTLSTFSVRPKWLLLNAFSTLSTSLALRSIFCTLFHVFLFVRAWPPKSLEARPSWLTWLDLLSLPDSHVELGCTFFFLWSLSLFVVSFFHHFSQSPTSHLTSNANSRWIISRVYGYFWKNYKEENYVT